MCSAQLRLAMTIDTFYGASDKASDSAIAAHAYRRSVEELDASIGRELVRGRFINHVQSPHIIFMSPFLSSTQDAPYRTTILDPLGKMNLYFPAINEYISKRNRKVVSHSRPRDLESLSIAHISPFPAGLAPRLRCRTQQSTQVVRKAKQGYHEVTQGLSRHSLDV